MSDKIESHHLERGAYVYVRQSTPHQVRNHLEGKERQYALAERAKQLGFATVVVIDEDLGRSGSGTQERPGFGRLLASVCQGLAGAVFALHQASFYAQFAFEPTWTFDAVLITFIGGVGTVIGPIIGAIFYIVVREELAVSFTQFHQIMFGILFILIVLLLPGGLIDLWSRFGPPAFAARRPDAKNTCV